MRFNPDADLNLSFIDTFVNGKEIHLTTILPKGNAMLEFLATYFQVGITALCILIVMVIVAMRMDRNSEIEHRTNHRH